MMMGSRPRFDSMVQIASRLTLSNAALKSIKIRNGPSTELISLFQYLAQGKDMIPAADTVLNADLVYPDSLRVGRFQTVFDDHFKSYQGYGHWLRGYSASSGYYLPWLRFFLFRW